MIHSGRCASVARHGFQIVVYTTVCTLACMHVVSMLVGYPTPPGSVCIFSQTDPESGKPVFVPFVESDPLAGAHAVYHVSNVLERTRSNFQVGWCLLQQLSACRSVLTMAVVSLFSRTEWRGVRDPVFWSCVAPR